MEQLRINVEDGNCVKDELDVVEGIKLSRGYLSPYFITDSNKYIVQYDNPLFLFYNGTISDPNKIINILEQCHNSNRALIIMANIIEGEALEFLIKNKLKAKCKVCCIKTPGGGDYKKYHLMDLSIITGGVMFDDKASLKLEDVVMADLGEASKIICYAENCIIYELSR